MVRALTHSVFVKFHCGKHAAEQRETALCRIHRVKRKLLVFLHVLIVRKRDSLHRGKQRNQCAIDTAGLSSDKLSDIRVLFLRHDTASGAVRIIDLHKLVFVGIPDDDLLRKAA